MPKIICLLSFLILLISCKKNAEPAQPTPETTRSSSGPDKYYVTVKDGLNVRSTPSLTGTRVTTLRYGTEVFVHERPGPALTIGNIPGYWVKVSSGNVSGWAFDGFLSSQMPEAKDATSQDSSSELSTALAKVANGSCINADKFALFSEEFYKHGRDPYARNGASGLVIDFGRRIFEATDGHEMCSGMLQSAHKLDEAHYQLNLKSNAIASDCKNDFQIDLTLYPNHLIVSGPLAHPGKYICLRVTEH